MGSSSWAQVFYGVPLPEDIDEKFGEDGFYIPDIIAEVFHLDFEDAHNKEREYGVHGGTSGNLMYEYTVHYLYTFQIETYNYAITPFSLPPVDPDWDVRIKRVCADLNIDTEDEPIGWYLTSTYG